MPVLDASGEPIYGRLISYKSMAMDGMPTGLRGPQMGTAARRILDRIGRDALPEEPPPPSEEDDTALVEAWIALEKALCKRCREVVLLYGTEWRLG
jgi:hypothetical protein